MNKSNDLVEMLQYDKSIEFIVMKNCDSVQFSSVVEQNCWRFFVFAELVLFSLSKRVCFYGFIVSDHFFFDSSVTFANKENNIRCRNDDEVTSTLDIYLYIHHHRHHIRPLFSCLVWLLLRIYIYIHAQAYTGNSLTCKHFTFTNEPIDRMNHSFLDMAKYQNNFN